MTLTAGAHGRMALLHITDIHADPFYDISGFGCGYKTATRNLTLQDKKGDAVKDRCGHSKRPVEPSCGPFSGDFIRMENWWRDTVRPGSRCPCGVAFSNPPYSVIPPLRAAVEEFAADRYESKVAIYSGDLAGHYMPGTSVKLDEAACTTARAVVKSTIDELDVPGIEHFFVLGNNDVIPKNKPLTSEWLEDLGEFLLNREWLTRSELSSWMAGGFYWRTLHETGLCAIGLNSNHWTPKLINADMQRAQLEWLPGILSRKGETANCTSGFLVVSHIGVVCPGLPVHGGAVRNDKLWGAAKTDAKQCGLIRAILDAHEHAIVAELAGDLNKEHVFATGTRSFGFTAVGVSPRGGNDAGFHRFFMSADGRAVTEIESYQMKRGCDFEFGHSFVDDYAPHFDAGFSGKAVASLINDASKTHVRRANVAPNAAGITKKMASDPGYADRVRRSRDGCLAEEDEEVPRAELVSRLEKEGVDLLEEDSPSEDGEEEDEEEDEEDAKEQGEVAAVVEEARAQAVQRASSTPSVQAPRDKHAPVAWLYAAAMAAALVALLGLRAVRWRSARATHEQEAEDLAEMDQGPDYVEIARHS